jgi:hypothetical protein
MQFQRHGVNPAAFNVPVSELVSAALAPGGGFDALAPSFIALWVRFQQRGMVNHNVPVSELVAARIEPRILCRRAAAGAASGHGFTRLGGVSTARNGQTHPAKPRVDGVIRSRCPDGKGLSHPP